MFLPGLKLCELFFHKAVKPILEAQFPNVNYAAALIGSGSEILGFDTERSTDHHWGPRAMLFVSPTDYDRYADRIRETFRDHLPHEFHGYSTHYTDPDPNDNGVQLLQPITTGPINHRVEVMVLERFMDDYLGIDIHAEFTPEDWLIMTGQKLRSITGGAVYHDGIGELTQLREKLAYYPRDVWLYLLAAGWSRIGEEEHFLGRTGDVGDELGSRLIAGRLVHDLMNLVFLMNKVYPPYSKWFGTAFSRLPQAQDLTPMFHQVFNAQTWQAREQALIPAYEYVARMHNALNITDPITEVATRFFSRPFKVIHGGYFADALIQCIQDEAVQRIAQYTLIGSVEQFSTSTALLSRTMRQIATLYGKPSE